MPPKFSWRDADVRRPRAWLFAGELYVARIKALRPGQWWFSLAGPDILERNNGPFTTPDEARTAAEIAAQKALG